MLDTIKKLETEGYIQLPYGQQRPPEFANTFQNPNSLQDISSKTEPICPTKMAAVKAILIEATDDYLGIMGRNIKAKIESCNCESSLRQTISSWHMAMRESKLGRESASFLMEQIHKTLEGKIISAENLAQSQH